MAESKSKKSPGVLAVFGDLDPTANAIEQLRKLGVSDDCMYIVSGVPVTEAMLGRPPQHSNVPRVAMGGAILGFSAASFLAFIAPYWYPYPIQVSTQAFVPWPPTFVILFELTMLGMLLSTFLAVFLDSFFPNYRPMQYVPEVSDGKYAIIVDCAHVEESKIKDLLKKLGAESIKPAEAQQL
ncbi:MAG TPA: hypothetical protein DEP19_08435 [Anaerolineae bacterium]|nr:hypothetical protein [Anaerolineae bacterium]HCK65605.1 hypothetical protein [Anaerolineae bacterium]